MFEPLEAYPSGKRGTYENSEANPLKFTKETGQLPSLATRFLVNSLNALSALIEESPAQASQFVDKLSKMYRYRLQANDQELVSMRMELAFMESYMHLSQTSYGTGVRARNTIPEDQLASSLPINLTTSGRKFR